MVDDNKLNMLRGISAPEPEGDAKARALKSAMAAYQASGNENVSRATQGTAAKLRLTDKAIKLWRGMMQKKLYATPAFATLLALPIASYTTYYLIQEGTLNFGGGNEIAAGPAGVEVSPTQTGADVSSPAQTTVEKKDKDQRQASNLAPTTAAKPKTEAAPQASADLGAVVRSEGKALQGVVAAEPQASVPGTSPVEQEALPAIAAAPIPSLENSAVAPARKRVDRLAFGGGTLVAPTFTMPPADFPTVREENRDRVEDFKSNPVHSAKTDPVSTFSIDVDTASYSFVRSSLNQGMLPDAETVRVEEMINYFPYDWKGPDSAAVPFNSTVTVMPTPWNEHTKLMHVAIKGYDVIPAQKPQANLVFLIDVSGSMDEPNKLPLLRSAFRLLINTLRPDDTVSIVTYAGDAGTVLEPTKVSERDKILNAIDTLTPGGSTAGEAGINHAYRLAEKSFVKDGVNRVMLATDGDFNVGQTDDEQLKKLIEDKRKSGVFLSVFGFGRGNLNDQMMQIIAQNGNGTAAYIDTLQEAEKVLVQDASSTIFPIAKDVKIQVEFNPATVAEYRLIGYETRALAREDFNNDRVDAGEIGSGHSVAAIYEVTPKGSPATTVDDLRYGEASTDNGGVSNAGEYAFVKIRYKAPDADVSKLITTPVTAANEVSSFDAASADQRFSIAVAAFGQKLRDTDQVSNFGFDRIIEIATAARGADPFGYRSEFLSLVRLAAGLEGERR
jgi:Ca-activated chloride channel family protein